MEDWAGNKSSYRLLGASNHTSKERETHDYYATEPKAIDILLEAETFSKNVWECACGEGHLSEQLIKSGHEVKSTDLIDRGYGQGGVDFLLQTELFDGDIVTNPPYIFAQEFIEKALSLVSDGHKVAMFLRLQFLESKKRKVLYTLSPPKVIYVSSSRLHCAKNAEFQKMKESGGNCLAFAWFVWVKGYQGDTILKWIN